MENESNNKKLRCRVFYWQYDDGSYGYIVFKEVAKESSQKKKVKNGYVTQGVCSGKTQQKGVLTQIKGQYEADGYIFKKKKIQIKTGIDYLSSSDLREKDKNLSTDKFQELEKFIDSCGVSAENRREVLRLFSSILSGYCARILTPLIQCNMSVPIQDRAFVIAIQSSDKYFDSLFDFLAMAIRALSVPTHTKSKKLYSQSPVILPENWNQRSIDQGAFLLYKKNRNYQFPAMYRDTAVLIYSRFFPTNDLYRFINRNRWAVVLLFDSPSKVYKVPPVRLEASRLMCSNFEWNVDDINGLVRCFISYISKLRKQRKCKKKLKRKLNRLQDSFLKYYSQKGIRRFTPTEDYFLTLQMLVLELFLDCCVDLELISNEQRQSIQSEWFNQLLPGCVQYFPLDTIPISREIQSENEQSKRILEVAVTKMLAEENLSHFPYVEEKSNFPKVDPDNPELQYWGYVRLYKPRKSGKEKVKEPPFYALVFKKADFEICIKDFLEKNNAVDELIEDMKTCKPKYLFQNFKARFPETKGDKKTDDALIFKIDEMEFLPMQIRQKLLDKHTVEKSPAKESVAEP